MSEMEELRQRADVLRKHLGMTVSQIGAMWSSAPSFIYGHYTPSLLNGKRRARDFVARLEAMKAKRSEASRPTTREPRPTTEWWDPRGQEYRLANGRAWRRLGVSEDEIQRRFKIAEEAYDAQRGA